MSSNSNSWGKVPPLSTLKANELLQYQIVPWDPTNPHHPARCQQNCLSVKSLTLRNYYYWIGCSKPWPPNPTQQRTTKSVPPIASPFAPAPQSSPSEASPAQEQNQSQAGNMFTAVMSRKRAGESPEQEGRNVRTETGTSTSGDTEPVFEPRYRY